MSEAPILNQPKVGKLSYEELDDQDFISLAKDLKAPELNKEKLNEIAQSINKLEIDSLEGAKKADLKSLYNLAQEIKEDLHAENKLDKRKTKDAREEKKEIKALIKGLEDQLGTISSQINVSGAAKKVRQETTTDPKVLKKLETEAQQKIDDEKYKKEFKKAMKLTDKTGLKAETLMSVEDLKKVLPKLKKDNLESINQISSKPLLQTKFNQIQSILDGVARGDIRIKKAELQHIKELQGIIENQYIDNKKMISGDPERRQQINKAFATPRSEEDLERDFFSEETLEENAVRVQKEKEEQEAKAEEENNFFDKGDKWNQEKEAKTATKEEGEELEDMDTVDEPEEEVEAVEAQDSTPEEEAKLDEAIIIDENAKNIEVPPPPTDGMGDTTVSNKSGNKRWQEAIDKIRTEEKNEESQAELQKNVEDAKSELAEAKPKLDKISFWGRLFNKGEAKNLKNDVKNIQIKLRKEEQRLKQANK